MGRPAYRRMTLENEQPELIVREALHSNTQLDLLVVVLPGTTPFYGKYSVSNMQITSYTSVELW